MTKQNYERRSHQVIQDISTNFLNLIRFFFSSYFNAFGTKENMLKGTKRLSVELTLSLVPSLHSQQQKKKTIIKSFGKKKYIMFGMILKTFYTCYSVEIFMGHTQKNNVICLMCASYSCCFGDNLVWGIKMTRETDLRSQDDMRSYKNSSGNAQ